MVKVIFGQNYSPYSPSTATPSFSPKPVLASTWRKSWLPFDKKKAYVLIARGVRLFNNKSSWRLYFMMILLQYRQYFINIAGSLILFTTILISANWALRLRWRMPSGHLPTSELSGNRCRRCGVLRLPTGCRWCCR